MTKDTPTVFDGTIRVIDWATRAVAVVLCFMLLKKLGSFHVPPPELLDQAWQAAMQFAWLNNLQFGRDIVFPHGPYGAFYSPLFHPDLVDLWYLVRMSQAVVLAIVLVWTFRARAGDSRAGKLLATGLAVMAAAATVPGPDAIWVLPSFLLIGLALDDRRTPPVLLILLVLAIALATLTKFSFLVIGVPALIAWTVAAAVRRDPLVFLAMPLYAATVALLWVAAGQEPSGFTDWLRASFLVARGYAPAMSITSYWGDLLAYGALVVVLLYGLWLGFRRDATPALRIIVLLGWAALFMLVAKAGFVRHDGHGVFPFEIAVVVAALVLAGVAPRYRDLGPRLALPVVALVFSVGWLMDAQLRLSPGHKEFQRKVYNELRSTPLQLIEIPNDLLSKRRKAALYEERAEESRTLLGGPHPRIQTAESVDVFTYKLSPPMQAGLPYRPRPVIQSYQAYLPELTAYDLAHIRENGAEVYVVEPVSIDNRPTLADGGYLWPEFLSRYDPVDEVPLGLLLERREVPVALDTRIVFDRRVRFNRWVELPAAKPGTLLQVQGSIRPTVAGHVVGLAYKPPQLAIRLRRADGGEQVHRLVPGQLGAGFPVAPILSTPADIAALFAGQEAGVPVTAFRIEAGRLQQAFWGSSFPLTVTEIHRPGQG